MSTQVSPVDPSSSSANAQSAAVDPAQSGQPDVSINGVNGATTIANIGELKEKAKPVYDALLMGIALRIRSEQEASMKRFKDEQRKMRQ